MNGFSSSNHGDSLSSISDLDHGLTKNGACPRVRSQNTNPRLGIRTLIAAVVSVTAGSFVRCHRP
jgi:hypothetical protein